MAEPDEHGSTLWRGILGIVLLGVALGIGQNALQRAGGPRRGLEWIKQEVKLASLESIAEAATVDSTTTNSPAAAGATAATGDSAKRATAAHDTSHVKLSPKAARAAAAAAKAAAAGARTAAKGATVPAKGSAAPMTAPATAAPAAAATPAADVPTVPDTREPLEAKYASIKKLYDAGVATFVDSRSPEEYAAGHISGAVNMPFDDVFKDPDLAKKLVTQGRPIVVTYCGGGECDLSRSLAFSLIDAGQKKVLVYMGGYPEWKEAGSAIVTGTRIGAAP